MTDDELLRGVTPARSLQSVVSGAGAQPGVAAKGPVFRREGAGRLSRHECLSGRGFDGEL